MRISDRSSDVCSSDLRALRHVIAPALHDLQRPVFLENDGRILGMLAEFLAIGRRNGGHESVNVGHFTLSLIDRDGPLRVRRHRSCSCPSRSEEHTSELQSLMRISYAVFCLQKKNTK